MAEEKMLAEAQQGLEQAGTDDRLVAVGEFFPRGHTGGMAVGGLAGSAAGGIGGSLGDALGLAAGSLVGMEAADAASGLPERVFVAVSQSTVYLMRGETHRLGHPTPGAVFGAFPRGSIECKVHQRVNVKVVELLDHTTGATVELEGSRIPRYHVGDVLDALRAD